MSQKIVPCLWFDANCEEAINFYVSAFSGMSGDKSRSKIHSIQRYEEGMQTPGIEQMTGKILTAIFELEGYQFMALDGGPVFKINPSISFMLNFDPSRDKNAKEHLDQLWKKLEPGGQVLMPLQAYPFSKHYGWVQDRFGVSWQLMLTDPTGDPRPFIIPSMLFVKDVAGKAKEAVDFYVATFENSKRGAFAPYPAGMEPDKEGTAMFSDFTLEDQWFAAMDSAHEHKFAFGEAISFLVNCKNQKELDKLWEALTTKPEFEQCGWLKDKYGVSWQIVPERMGVLLSDPDKQKSQRVLNAMLQMKKIDIAKLEQAYKGN